MKKILISLLTTILIISCKTEEKKIVTVNKNPLIQYYKDGKDVLISSSDFQMGKEYEFCEKGVTLILNGDFEGGETEFLKALSINPNSINTLSNLGNLKFMLREFPDAINYLNESIRLSDSTYFPAVLNLGRLYGLLGEDKKAEKLFNHIIENSEVDFLIGVSHFGLAQMYLDYGWIEKAKLSFSKSEFKLKSYSDFEPDLDTLKLEIENYNK